MSLNPRFLETIERVSETKACRPAVDAHLHLVDFLQDTDGLEKLLIIMNKAGIERSVICGLPVRKKWEYFEPEKPHYYLSDDSRCYYFASTDETVASEYLKLTPKKREKFAPLLCGFNPTDRLAIDYVECMFKKYPFWKGVGELLLRHDDLTSLIMDETARANHPALFEVYAFCAEQNLPVCIHQNSTSVGHVDHFEYLHEMKEALDKFPNTTFVWAHCGASRRIINKNYAKMVTEMLWSHLNLHIDISWVVYDDIICDNLMPKPEWLALFQQFPDRIMLGTDLCGHFELLGQTIARYNNLLRVLPDSISERIASKNAEELFFLR
jgi:hypothetical protein